MKTILTFDEEIYDKIKRAEWEEEHTDVRYTSEQILADVEAMLDADTKCDNVLAPRTLGQEP